MTAPVSIDGLTTKEREFVEWYCRGLTQTQAAARVGYSNPAASGRDLMMRPKIQQAIEAARAQYQDLIAVSRMEVVDGVKEAIDMARTLSDPMSMIAGWREIARMAGYYEPAKTKVEINVTGNVTLEQLATKSDAELLKIIEGERIE